ncbi:MAG: tetratricopeptide repeat-containing sensor histidine kinase [Marinilabiliaceae bacterium]|nr:tetratricopeptide repeat-containing sensor histidine kinase [Marinilabiliaceae bacterium]
MLKNFYITFLFLCLFIWGCNQKVDRHDTSNEGDKLITLASDALDISIDDSREYAQKALEYAIENNDELIEAKAYYRLSVAGFITKEYTQAIEYAQLSENLFLKLDDFGNLAALYSTLATGYYHMKDYETSDIYSEKAITMAEFSHDIKVLLKQYHLIALKLYEQNEYFSAINYLLKGLEFEDETKEIENLKMGIISLLGSIYKELEINQKALFYYKQSIEYAEKENLNRNLIHLYNNISNVYNSFEQYDSSYIYCQKSLQISQSINVNPLIALSYASYAMYHKNIQQYDSAIFYISKSIDLVEESNHHSLYEYYNVAGVIYYESEDYDKALFYAKDALELAIEANNLSSIHKIKRLIAEIYYANQMYEFASFYQHQYILGDSIRTRNFSLIQEELLRFSEREIHKQTQSKIEEIDTKRKVMIYVLLISVLFIGILIFAVTLLIKQRNRINQINEELKTHKDELEQIVEYKSVLLDDKEQQYANLCNNMFNGAVFRMEFNTNDIRSCDSIFLSSGWKQLTGQEDDCILFFDSNISTADSDHLLKSLTKAIQTCSILDTSFRYLKDNETLWFHVRAKASKSPRKGYTYLDGYLVDETDQKSIEEILFKAKEKAEESDRLKTAFLNNISHEIRTPMNGIVGFSNLLVNDQIPESEKHTFLQAINDNCYQLISIINDIIELSKIETGQFTLNINEITLFDIETDIVKLIIPVNKDRFPQLEFIIDNSFLHYRNLKIITDRSYIQMVFEYLIENAGKFSKDDGQVIIGINAEINSLTFYVKDNGIGISNKDFDVIFDNFIKINPLMGNGTGLGLPIVKGIVTKLGGNVWVESEENKGSTFYFSIPI